MIKENSNNICDCNSLANILNIVFGSIVGLSDLLKLPNGTATIIRHYFKVTVKVLGNV